MTASFGPYSHHAKDCAQARVHGADRIPLSWIAFSWPLKIFERRVAINHFATGQVIECVSIRQNDG